MSTSSFVTANACQFGKVTGGGLCIVGSNSQVHMASFGFNAMWFSRDPKPKGELNYVDQIAGLHVNMHQINFLEVSIDLPGNKPYPMQHAYFYGPCTINGVGGHFAWVQVNDNGEPSKTDAFYIVLDTGYLGGSITIPILTGNIQIHNPPK